MFIQIELPKRRSLAPLLPLLKLLQGKKLYLPHFLVSLKVQLASIILPHHLCQKGRPPVFVQNGVVGLVLTC